MFFLKETSNLFPRAVEQYFKISPTKVVSVSTNVSTYGTLKHYFQYQVMN